MKSIIITIAVMCVTISSKSQITGPNFIFPKGKIVPANFIGTVWVQPLLPQDSVFNLVAGSVVDSCMESVKTAKNIIVKLPAWLALMVRPIKHHQAVSRKEVILITWL